MTSLMTVIRKCYWAWIFIDKHKEESIFITRTFRTFFLLLWNGKHKLSFFSVCCETKRNGNQEFWRRDKVTPCISEALHATGPKQSP